MILIWLLVWVLKGTPSFDFTAHNPSPWLISLVIILIIDVFGTSRRL